MALRQLPTSIFRPLFPLAAATNSPAIMPFLNRFQYPLNSSISILFPTAAIISIPSLLGDIWESILRAVPKKKTSHMKKRHRQMAGKGLKDVTALSRCSGCGKLKRAHVLCPTCVESIRHWLKKDFQPQPQEKEEP